MLYARPPTSAPDARVLPAIDGGAEADRVVTSPRRRRGARRRHGSLPPVFVPE